MYDLLGSLSQETAPLLDTLTNLYWNEVPAGRVAVIDHKGLLLVYPEAERGTAEAVFHEPSWGIDPTSLMVSPTTVVTRWLKVTDTVEQGEGLVVGPVDDEVDEVDEVGDGSPPEPPVIAMSAQDI